MIKLEAVLSLDLRSLREKKDESPSVMKWEAGEEGIVISFPDGRRLVLTPKEWLDVGVFALGDASRYRPEVIAYRKMLITELTRLFRAEIDGLQTRLAELVPPL